MKEQFLSHLPKDGTGIGNGSLQKLLNWDDATYNSVKASLIEEGTIAMGRGRGGSVKLAGSVPQANPAPVNEAAPISEVPATETATENASSEELVEKEQPKVEETEEVTSALDPVVAAVDSDEKAGKVIEALQKHYQKTKFYTVRDGEYLKVKIQLKDFGGRKQSLSPDILEIARQRAADSVDPEKNLEKVEPTKTEEIGAETQP